MLSPARVVRAVVAGLAVDTRTAMAAAAAMQREAIRLLSAILVSVRPRWHRRLRRAARNESRQRIDMGRLRLRRTRLVADFRRLGVALLARLIGLRVALNEGLCVRRDIGLRLARAECSLGGEGLTVVVAVLEIVVRALLELLVVAAAAFGARREVRVLLAELFVRHRDQAEIMFGMLEVIFRR